MSKQKIILDTDIGDDIDDAMALALALEMPGIELVGVTTVFRDTDKRARIAKKMLKLWGADIPVYAGMRDTDIGNMSVDGIPCQYTPELEDSAYAPLNDVNTDGGEAAIDFIIRSAETYAGELTIVAIGAMTNIAAALEKAPESMKKVKQIVIMGGCYYNQYREWNVLCNPPAAKKVFSFDGRLACIGLDVTRQTRLNLRQYTDMLSAKVDEKRDYLISLVKLHGAKNKCLPVLHDPLSLYFVVHPEILFLEPARVVVETEGDYSVGMTLNLDIIYNNLPYRLKGKRILVAKDVSAEEFVEEFLRIVFRINDNADN